MTPVDGLGLGFALLALLAAGGFFWVGRNVAGFAFMAAFVIALAGVLQQRVVFSSAVVGLVVETSNQLAKQSGVRGDE
jgi:hypothetical protein